MQFLDLLVEVGSKGAEKWRARAGDVLLSFDRKQYHVPTYQAEYSTDPTALLGVPGTWRHSVVSSTIEHVCHWLVQEGHGSMLVDANWELLETA